MYNTFYYLVVYNIVMISMALILALLLNYPSTKLKRVFRTVYFLPITFSLVLVAFTFEMVYHKDFGLLNQVLHLIGLNIQFDWLRDINLALNALISMRVWRVVGFYMIIILAGLQSIPQSLYEVAEIDGANIFQKVIHITIPLLIPTLLLVIVMSTVWSFQLFTEPWLLTQGGPAYATETIALYTYKNAFLYSDFGYASALATVMALIIIFVSMLQIRFLWQKGGLA